MKEKTDIWLYIIVGLMCARLKNNKIRKENQMKVVTIRQLIGGIIKQKPANTLGDYTDVELLANEATIYLKTALICEAEGIEKAMEYFKGFHSEDEYKDFLPGGLMGDPLEK